MVKNISLKYTGENKARWYYFLYVFILSALIWMGGPILEKLLNREIPVDLPISSLMVISPITAAFICIYKEEGSFGVKNLLKRIFDQKRIENKIWYAVIILSMPCVMLLEYVILEAIRRPLPALQWPKLSAYLFIPIFFIAAICEEIGWQAYVYDRLLKRWNALYAGILLGFIWSVWHIIPLIQLHKPPVWVFWQSINILVTRVLIVWIYQNTGRSLFGSILFHTMVNISTVLLPNFGILYDPIISTLILIAYISIVLIHWAPEILAVIRPEQKIAKS